MVLTYPGGVFLPKRTDALKHTKIFTAADVGEVYLSLGDAGYTVSCKEGAAVRAGTLLAELQDGTPVYASMPGIFEGVFENHGVHYAKVTASAQSADQQPLAVRLPEQKKLGELTGQELLEAAKMLGIWDFQGGDWLWRRAAAALGKTRRVVVDLTDPNGWSFTGYRTALRAPGDILSGAKVLLHLLGATKIILVVNREHRKVTEVLRTLINDPALVILAEVEGKYPLREETLYEALYAKRLPRGRSAQDEGVFLVRGQTAEALYRSLLTGVPHLTRWVSAAGEGFGLPAVFRVPFGTTWKRILELCSFKGGAYEVRLDSTLNGLPAEGVLGGGTESVLAAMPAVRAAEHCISCGRCAEVCPMRLLPYRILREKDYRAVKALAAVCFDCGCCEYICPSSLPLRELIARHRGGKEDA